MNKKFEIIVCASGGGGNFQKIIDKQNLIGYKIVKLICDKECAAIKRAVDNNIEYVLIDKKKLKPTEFEKQIKKELDINPDLIVLAGFMTILSKDICCMFGNKIINTHPSLLPKYGGKGMYGVKVQESVMKNKEVYAGCSTHFVTSEIDAGEIIFQEKIKIDYSLTPWELGGKIFDLEGDLLIKTIQNIMFK